MCNVQRVDLHIYIIPPELWQEHLHSAVNQVIGETISAGFIRYCSCHSNPHHLAERH